MAWIQINDRLPATGVIVKCKMRNSRTGETVIKPLVRSVTYGCDWRIADGCRGISFDWDILAWEDPHK